MNLTHGIFLSIVMGDIGGWVGRMLMGMNALQGILTNVVVDVFGASIGGFLARLLFADERGSNRLVASFGVPLVGASVLIAAWKVIARQDQRPRTAEHQGRDQRFSGRGGLREGPVRDDQVRKEAQAETVRAASNALQPVRGSTSPPVRVRIRKSPAN